MKMFPSLPLLPIIGLLAISSGSRAMAQSYPGSLYSDVWAVAQDKPYEVLPETKVTVGSFFEFAKDKLMEASERTVQTQDDVLPYFKKLVHPNGICLSGTWNITEQNPYSGYFKQDSKGLIILRGSAALSPIHRGEKRSFGLAGKIFPTLDPKHKNRLATANFFTIDNLGGTYTPNFMDTILTNDITSVDFGFANLGQTGILAAAAKAFSLADRTLGSLPTVRQLYEISELGESDRMAIRTPKYLKIQGQTGVRTENRDFRDDLRVEANGGVLRFDISVADDGIPGTKKNWTKIGYVEVNESSTAEGCDHRIHFHHPRWRSDLR